MPSPRIKQLCSFLFEGVGRSSEAASVPASDGASPGTVLASRLRQSKLFQDYQQAFENTTGLPLVLREASSTQRPLEGSLNLNPFCALMSRSNKTCAACLQLQQQIEQQATHATKTLQCYAGLHETAMPVRVGDHLLGYGCLDLSQRGLRQHTGQKVAPNGVWNFLRQPMVHQKPDH